MSTQQAANRTYTIMEAAKLSGLPESTLRYYETIGIIDPIQRDASSKHRVYSEDDVNLIVAVSCLSATGMSIEDMRQYLGNRTKGTDAAEEQIQLLEHQKQRLIDEAHYLELRRRYVNTKIDYWKAVKGGDEGKIQAVREYADSIATELKHPRNK